MRIIGTDEVIDRAKTEAAAMPEPFKSNFADLVKWIVDKTSTAYDVNEVVEKLKEEEEYSHADFESYAKEHGIDSDDDWHYLGLKRAAEIVKGGGTE